jgi:hypothetical protein
VKRTGCGLGLSDAFAIAGGIVIDGSCVAVALGSVEGVLSAEGVGVIPAGVTAQPTIETPTIATTARVG